jgi:hypothetical protein
VRSSENQKVIFIVRTEAVFGGPGKTIGWKSKSTARASTTCIYTR